MVREGLDEKVLEVRYTSMRVLVVVLMIGKVMVRVIAAYAPQKNVKEEEKVKF